MNKILNKLYELIPLDKTTRDFFLKQLLETEDNALAIIFSIQEHLNYSPNSINTSTNKIYLTDAQINETLLGILNSNSAKEVNDSLTLLDIKHQIVLKQIITNSTMFNRSVILENIHKLYTLVELKTELMKNVPKEQKGVQYIIHSKPTLTYIYRGGSKYFSNSAKGSVKHVIPNNFCYVIDGEVIKAEGDKNLYRYLIGETTLPKLFTELPTYSTLDELNAIKERNTGKYITVLYKDEPATEYIEPYKMEVTPFDWLIDEYYNPIGIQFMYEDRTYSAKFKVSKKTMKEGLSSFKVVIGYNIKNNKLVKIQVKEIKDR